MSGTTTTVGTFTLAHAGSDDLVGFAGKTSDFEEIVAGTTDVICVKQTSTASWTCYSGAEVASLGASLTALEDVFGSHAALEYLRALAPAGTHLTQSTGSFAGQSVSCWTATTASNSGTYTYCVTSAGVIAEAIGKDSTSSWRMVLTSYSSSVPSSEFTPPATPSTIPTGT
ncbi:MAG TPA: hypothetical protein VEH29_02590 [Acidimicrobiales bacterium]|nr:hypothetical protein [Acidimicrobiales bacterium]